MSTDRQILILYSDVAEPLLVTQLAEAITVLGSTTIVRRLCDGQYENVLDAVAIVDNVIYWPPDIACSDGQYQGPGE